MSQRLINHSPDLKRLRDEGYNIEIRSGFLLVKDIPYVNARKQVQYGILVSELTLAGEVTAPPSTHVAKLVGEYPCNKDGQELSQIALSGGERLAENLTVNHSFSSKPVASGRYRDYYEKMTAYAAIFLTQAQAIDPQATAQPFSAIPGGEDESVFNYVDTASSRAGIGLVTQKLALSRVAIVGLGGTGAYVLDLVAKTPVREIHLFDGDVLLCHNAFRTPGAASIEELAAKPKKVSYLKGIYSKMHRGIIEHDYNITASNAAELHEMDFVFLCVDGNEAKRAIVESLEATSISFIDVGIGVDLVENFLHGIVRVTTSSAGNREHFRERVSLADALADDAYRTNIQIADLNSLNAAFAVIRWKKLYGFYADYEKEHHMTYTVDTNLLTSDSKDEAPVESQS